MTPYALMALRIASQRVVMLQFFLVCFALCLHVQLFMLSPLALACEMGHAAMAAWLMEELHADPDRLLVSPIWVFTQYICQIVSAPQ